MTKVSATAPLPAFLAVPFIVDRNATGYNIVLNNPHATGGGLNVTVGTPTNIILRGQVTGDASYRFVFDGNGTMWWGPGTVGGYDVYLYRSGVGAIRTDGKMFAQGGFITPLATKAADYTLTTSDGVILANALMTATLPSAVTAGAGRRFTVRNIHASAVVTLAAAAGNINGGATVAIAAGASATVVSDGANWWVI